MANTLAPQGFKFWGWKQGGNSTLPLIPKLVSKSYGTQLFRGDLVYTTTSGYIQQSAAGQSVTNVAGIFFGIEYLSTAGGSQVFRLASSTSDMAADGNALIIPFLPGMLFLAVSSGTAITKAAIGSNIDINTGNAGTVTSGFAVSGMCVDPTTISTGQGSSGATGAAYPFKVYDLFSNYAAPGLNGADNTTSYNWVLVEPNPYAVAGTH